MVLHKCNICEYETIYPTNYKNHLKSVKHMRNVEKYNNEKNTTTSPESTNNAPNNAPNNTSGISTEIKKKIICKYCQTSFTRKSSLNRHLQENRCIAKLEFDEEKKEQQIKEKKTTR